MIVREIITIKRKDYIKTYSDMGLLIQKVGTEEIYEEAIDLEDSNFEYIETEQLISSEPMESEIIIN